MNKEQAEIIVMLANPVISMLAVVVGGRIAYKSTLKSQHEMMKKKIILEKLEFIKENISDITRGMALILENLSYYCKHKISKEEFIKNDCENQEIVRIAQRNLWVTRVYINPITQNIDRITERYKNISNAIYDIYHLDDDCNEELYPQIFKAYSELITDTTNICEEIDEYIIKEVNAKKSKFKINKKKK